MSVRKKAVKTILDGVIKAGKNTKNVKPTGAPKPTTPKRTYNTKKQNDINKANNKAELNALAKKKATPPPKLATSPKPPLQKVSTVKQTPKEASKAGFKNDRVLPPNVKITKISKAGAKPVKTPAKKAVKTPVKKAVKKVPVKKAVKKAPAKTPVKKVAKKAPVKTPAKKAPVKTPAKKPTKPKGVSGGAYGKDSKGNVIVMGGKKGDLKGAQDFYKNKARNANVTQRPVQGPPTRAEQSAINARGKPQGPVQGPRGGREAKEAYDVGRKQFRKDLGRNAKKAVKGAVTGSARLAGKGIKGSITPAIVGGAAYYVGKGDSKNVRRELNKLQQSVDSMQKVTPAKPSARVTPPVSTPTPKPTPRPRVESPNQRTTPDSWKKIAKKYGYNF
tara:strand:+ start:6133 stop:7299 length:1167 start_codon:yes stop_codon:yes gene_type:complete